MAKIVENEYNLENFELDLQKDLAELDILVSNCSKNAVFKMQALRGQLLISRYKYETLSQERFDEYRGQLDNTITKFNEECICKKIKER